MRAQTIRNRGILQIWVLVSLLLWVSSAPLQAQEKSESVLVSLTADSTSVVEILQMLAERSGLNIVTGSEVQGQTISLRLSGTPFEEALNLVCRASGFGYERVGNSILVADPQRLSRPTGLDPKVFELHYADALDIRDVLEVINPDIKAEVRGNRLVMWAPKAVLQQAERTILELDRKPAQVLLESRLIEVNISRLEELGIDWERITKWTTIVTEGDQGSSPPDQFPEDFSFFKLGEGDNLYRQAAAFEVAIDLLIKDGSARQISNTKIVTLDGEPAEIFAGETVPVVLSSLTSPEQAGGVLQTLTLEKIDVGVKLNITPRIGSDGYITTLVEPEVSRIVAFIGPYEDLPQTATRRARSFVRVKGGQKIFMGGLLAEETRKSVKKVPILGSIPLLGYLFQHHKNELNRWDLVIEITPRIVGDVGEEVPESVSWDLGDTP